MEKSMDDKVYSYRCKDGNVRSFKLVPVTDPKEIRANHYKDICSCLHYPIEVELIKSYAESIEDRAHVFVISISFMGKISTIKYEKEKYEHRTAPTVTKDTLSEWPDWQIIAFNSDEILPFEYPTELSAFVKNIDAFHEKIMKYNFG